jgi:hypothetical protein
VSNERHTAETDSLRYLEANAVECPGGKLEGVSLVSKDDEAIGAIDGVLIHPGTRQLRYFVVERPRLFNRRRYLVSADMPAIVMRDDRSVRVEVPLENVERERFDSRAVARFSDDDLLTAMFASHTAS